MAHHVAGLCIHRHDAGGIAHDTASRKYLSTRHQGIKFFARTMQDECDIRIARSRTRSAGHDGGRAVVTAHGVQRHNDALFARRGGIKGRVKLW